MIEGINDIVRRQQEREGKLKTQRQTSKVNVTSVEESEILKELKALRLDVNDIKKKRGQKRVSTLIRVAVAELSLGFCKQEFKNPSLEKVGVKTGKLEFDQENLGVLVSTSRMGNLGTTTKLC